MLKRQFRFVQLNEHSLKGFPKVGDEDCLVFLGKKGIPTPKDPIYAIAPTIDRAWEIVESLNRTLESGDQKLSTIETKQRRIGF